MLARKYTLKHKSDFEKIEQEGKVYQSPSFGLAYIERGDQNEPRFGFIVSTKVSRLAVQRNRVRRAMHEAVRYSLVSIKKGVDVVFLAKQVASLKATDELMREVKLALMDVGLAR